MKEIIIKIINDLSGSYPPHVVFEDWVKAGAIAIQNEYTNMEIEKLRAACRTNREKAMIEVLISTWCRVYEFANIRISDIKDNQIKVLGKGDKERIVYLTPKAQLAVECYLNERSDSNPYLFPRAKYAGSIWKFASKKGAGRLRTGTKILN